MSITKIQIGKRCPAALTELEDHLALVGGHCRIECGFCWRSVD
jgi:hypothetical protein